MAEYYTCFGFKDFSNDVIDNFHVTHKYLGQQDRRAIDAVSNCLALYFKEYSFETFSVEFNRVENFGDASSPIRVLLAESNLKFLTGFQNLRSVLDVFRKDDYPSYRPHVTSNEEKMTVVVDRYCLVQGRKVIWEHHFT